MELLCVTCARPNAFGVAVALPYKLLHGIHSCSPGSCTSWRLRMRPTQSQPSASTCLNHGVRNPVSVTRMGRHRGGSLFLEGLQELLMDLRLLLALHGVHLFIPGQRTTLDRHRSPQQKMTFGLIHVGPIPTNHRALFAPDEVFRELRIDTRTLPRQAAIG